MNHIEQTYTNDHPRSHALYESSKKHFPDGVTHDGRYLEPFPLYMVSGKGCRKRDVDGRTYIDYVMGHGALLLGHSDPRMVEAVTSQAAIGTHLGASTELEATWAERVKAFMPSLEKVRFHSSGTEAISMALRLARAYSGRAVVAKFERHFHGWHDSVIADPEKYSSAGIPHGADDDTIRIAPGDIAGLEKLLSGREVAALIVEPTGARMGSYPIDADYIRAARKITQEHGTLLIFDEVVTGFRVSPGGAQVRYDIQPDLCALGKILGGGLPGAASAGRADIMEMIAHRPDNDWNLSHRIGHPGTFNANPLSAAAGVACLDQIVGGEMNQRADHAAERLIEGINSTFRRTGIVGFAHGLSSIVKVVFGMEPPDRIEDLSKRHAEISKATNAETNRLFKLSMLNRGVDTMGAGRLIVSAVHSDDDVDKTVKAFEHAIGDLAAAGELTGRR